jgi:hypothetical protein
MLYRGRACPCGLSLSRRGDFSSLPPALLLIDLFVEGLRPAFEHSDRPGSAWCGAEVIGVRGRGLGVVDCVV